MDVDDEDDQLARRQALVHFFLQGAVVVAVVEVILHHLVGVDEVLELLPGAVVVVHALLLAGAGCAGGGGDGLLDLRVGGAQRLDHAVLSGTGGTGYHKQILFVFHITFAPPLNLCPRPDRRRGWPPFRAEGQIERHGRSP